MKKLFALLAVLILICMGTAVSAETTASINSTTFIATINADCPNADFALIMIKNRTSGEYVWASQETVTNGSITNFQAPLDSGIAAGWYDVTVTDNKMGIATTSFYFATQDYKNTVLGEINALKNNPTTAQTDLVDILTDTDKAPLFTYDTAMFAKITNTTALYSAIIAETYTSIEQFSQKVDEIVSNMYVLQVKDVAIAAFNDTSASGMTGVLESYYDLFGITLGSLYYENSSFVNGVLSGTTISDIDEVAPAFNTAIALAEVNNAERAELMTVFQSYDSHLGIYNRLSSLSRETLNTVLKIIEQKTYTKVSDIAQDISSAVMSGPTEEAPEYDDDDGDNIINVSNDLLDAERPQIIQDVNDEGLVFYDLNDAKWAKDSILRLYELGVVNGRTETEFAPNAVITRAEFARLAVEAFNPEGIYETEPFADVELGKWYYTSVMTAREAGIVSGDENNCFKPESNLAIQDAAIILCKVLGLDKATDAELFADDADISNYAKGYVYALKAAGIVSGNADGVFAPKSYATRAQCAVMIDKALGEVE